MEKASRKPEQASGTGSTGAVLCPFFLGHSAHELHCEGVVDDSRIITRYRRACDKTQHMRLFCRARYSSCEIHRMLMRDKYGEEDD